MHFYTPSAYTFIYNDYGSPPVLRSLKLNSTTLFLKWHDSQMGVYCSHCIQNNETIAVTKKGLMRQYYIEVTDNSTGAVTIHMTEETHYLIHNLQPSHMYTFRVAAHEVGPYSLPISVFPYPTKGTGYKLMS